MASSHRPVRVLILGGTTEASAIARALAGDARFAATLSLAGRTSAPVLPPVPHRIGGFGGVAGLVRALGDFDLLLDATHPFAARITANAVAAAEQTGVPLLCVQRPAWVEQSGDLWTVVPDLAAACTALGSGPQRVLLTVGGSDLQAFAASRHHYVIRTIEAPPPGLLPDALAIQARGPFDLAAECALMREHRIGVLVSKNSGGSATRAKLDAARELGVRVIMVARPLPPDAASVPDVAGAMAWLDQHAGMPRGV